MIATARCNDLRFIMVGVEQEELGLWDWERVFLHNRFEHDARSCCDNRSRLLPHLVHQEIFQMHQAFYSNGLCLSDTHVRVHEQELCLAYICLQFRQPPLQDPNQ